MELYCNFINFNKNAEVYLLNEISKAGLLKNNTNNIIKITSLDEINNFSNKYEKYIYVTEINLSKTTNIVNFYSA